MNWNWLTVEANFKISTVKPLILFSLLSFFSLSLCSFYFVAFVLFLLRLTSDVINWGRMTQTWNTELKTLPLFRSSIWKVFQHWFRHGNWEFMIDTTLRLRSFSNANSVRFQSTSDRSDKWWSTTMNRIPSFSWYHWRRVEPKRQRWKEENLLSVIW